LYKNKKLFMLLLLIALVAYVVSESIKEEKAMEAERNRIEMNEEGE